MLMLAIQSDINESRVLANTAIILAGLLLVVNIFVMFCIPVDRFHSYTDSLRSCFRTLRERLSWTRSKEDDLP